MDCVYSVPLNYLGNPPGEAEFWQFSEMNCGLPEYYTFIQNPETESSFYLTKTLTYGDILVVVFLSLFLLFGIIKILWGFFFGFKSFFRK